jgi:glycosyltransferase involved in cell wall biosynthesis
MRVAVTVEQSWHVVPGGIATATVELLRALAARGDVDLVGVAARHAEPPPADLTPPVEVRPFALPRRALYASWQWLRRPVVERATGRVDVVHDAGYVVPPSRAPLVATVHDLAFLEYPSHYGWRTLAALRRGMALARREACLVMCPSGATIDACRAAGFDPARLRLVPWGVSAAPVDVATVDGLRARYALDRPYVLFVGTIEPRKNLPRVIDAFRGLGREDVLLVLAGPRGWKEDVADAVDGGVRWLGAVARDDLAGLYAGAAAFVYPSLLEGFGLPVLEAMAHGTPVVTSAGTATAEVAGDAAVLVDPLDADAIAEGVDRVLRDAELSARLRSRGRIRAGAFTWERSAELAMEVYAEAAAGSSG